VDPAATPVDPAADAAASGEVDASASLGAGARDEVAEASGDTDTAAATGNDFPTDKKAQRKVDAIRADDPGMMKDGRREGVMTSDGGSVGLFHTALPDVGGRYTFRFRVHTDFFKKTGFMYDGTNGPDKHSRVRGAITMSFSPFKWGEIYFAVKSSANRNVRPQADRQDAESVFALGDLDFGMKGAWRFKNGIGIGGLVGVGLLSGSSKLRTASANFWFDGLFSADLRYVTKKQVPVRLTANVGWILDNSLRVAPFGDISDGPSREVSRFSLGGNQSRVRMRYAVDFPVRLGKKKQFGIDPIAEWSWDVTTTEKKAFAQPGARPSPLPRSSQWLTLGMRANVISGLHLDVAADIGLVSPSFQWGPRTPPWQIILGLGWSFDPKPQIKEVEKEVEAPPPTTPPPALEGRIVGQVVDPAGVPIPDAKLLFPGAASNAILTDASGAFTSFRFPAGTIAVQVEVNGQVAHEATAEVKDGEDTTLQIQLTTTPALPTGIVQGIVTDAQAKAVAFSMRVSGQGVDEPFNSTEDGRIALELAAGDYRGTITAAGFKEKIITFTVPPKGEININEQLERDAPVATPRVSGGKGVIKLKGGIKYEGNAVAASSHSLLDELAAFLNGHPEYVLVEIGVHTDDRGAAQQRSDERADSVKGYLVAKGVSAARLTAKGFGASKPVAVNLTEQGRAKNNRTVLTVKKKG
jgi:outer membrane protein OmpA-like peptidoglycan-associated protein